VDTDSMNARLDEASADNCAANIALFIITFAEWLFVGPAHVDRLQWVKGWAIGILMKTHRYVERRTPPVQTPLTQGPSDQNSSQLDPEAGEHCKYCAMQGSTLQELLPCISSL
jgi:hypothetical protein